MSNITKNNMTAIPFSRNNRVGFRSNISSEDENKNNTDNLKDILELYNKFNELSEELMTIYDCISIENIFLLEEIDRLKNTIANTGNTIYVYPNNIKQGKLPADINTITNDITMSNSYSVSKLRIEDIDESDYDNRSIIIPKNIIIDVHDEYEGNINIISIIDNDVKNMITEYNDTPFVRKVITDETMNKVSMEIIITIPDAIIDDYNINEISLLPFPTNNVYIEDIKYRISNGTWTTIPSFNEHDGYVPNKGLKCNCRFNFNNITANQIKIKLTTEKYIEDNTNRLFILGIKNIDVRYKEITDETNMIEMDLTFPARDKKIKSIEPIYNNNSQIDYNNITYEFLYKGDNGEYIHINQHMPLMVPSKECKVKINIYNKETFINISKFKVEVE